MVAVNKLQMPYGLWCRLLLPSGVVILCIWSVRRQLLKSPLNTMCDALSAESLLHWQGQHLRDFSVDVRFNLRLKPQHRPPPCDAASVT
mmetsp:Transcript_18294/g.42720  ORF Transcript_18294/g.42720 Transcript_18294/m.42720 type:complete len:89 (+) Transcript_18294:2198-2464(+)